MSSDILTRDAWMQMRACGLSSAILVRDVVQAAWRRQEQSRVTLTTLAFAGLDSGAKRLGAFA